MLTIPNVATTDKYSDALTLQSVRVGGGVLAFVVANASVFMQLQPLYNAGSAAADFDPTELLITPSQGTFDGVTAVRFRSAVAGTPAQVIAQLYEAGDPRPQGAVPFGGVLSGGGGVSPVASGQLLRIINISASGTYTPSADAVSAMVEVIGAGGGGGSTGAAANTGSGGGGGGGYARKYIAALAASYAVVIGAGGAGGTAPGGAGGNGGVTTFGGIISVQGGEGGANAPAGLGSAGGRGGGTVTGGDLNFPGQSGGSGTGGTAAATARGVGGSPPAGAGGGPNQSVVPTPGGGGQGATGSSVNGAQGGDGAVIVTEYG